MLSVKVDGEELGWFKDDYWGNFAFSVWADEMELDSDGKIIASYWAGYKPGIECLARMTELGVPVRYRPEWGFAKKWEEVPNADGLIVFRAPLYEEECLNLRHSCRVSMLLPEPPGKSRYEMLGTSLRDKKLLLVACGGVPVGQLGDMQSVVDLWRKLGE